MKIANFSVNDEGVSPIVATLVLIVVAIIGAAAVGLIMGSFSSQVSNQASSSNAADQASTTLNVGGGLVIYPLDQILADAYMRNNTGVKVTVSQTGSPMGWFGAADGTYQIGSSDMPPANPSITVIQAKYPNLKATTIGMDGMVFIGGSGTTVTTVDCTLLGNAYHTGLSSDISTAIPGATTLITASHPYVPADAVDSWLMTGTGSYQSRDVYKTSANVLAYTDNVAMLAAIQQNPHYFGFIDYGFAASAGSTVKDFYTIHDGTGAYTASYATMIQAEKDYYNGLSSSTSYPISLVFPLQYITNGVPSTLEQSFINYALNPDNEWAFQKANLHSLYDITK